MIDELRRGFISALVMESSMLSNRDATMCDTLLIRDIFDAVDVVAAFPRGFDQRDTVLRCVLIVKNSPPSAALESHERDYVCPFSLDFKLKVLY